MTIDAYAPAALGPAGWMQRAACRRADPELFHPVGRTGPQHERQVTQAKQICQPSDVRENCLLAGIRAQATGIWGGTTEDERSALVRAPRRLAAAARSGRVRTRRRNLGRPAGRTE